jgi:hypothetical protein
MALALLNNLLREVNSQWQAVDTMDELVALIPTEPFATSISSVWAVVHESSCDAIADIASNANFTFDVRGLSPSKSVCEAIRNPICWAAVFKANAPDASRSRGGLSDKIKDLHVYMKNYGFVY